MSPLGELDETYARVFFDSGPFAPLYENMMSSTKPEVRNILHCCQRMTEPQVTCTENLVKFGCEVFEICDETDRQTD